MLIISWMFGVCLLINLIMCHANVPNRRVKINTIIILILDLVVEAWPTFRSPWRQPFMNFSNIRIPNASHCKHADTQAGAPAGTDAQLKHTTIETEGRLIYLCIRRSNSLKTSTDQGPSVDGLVCRLDQYGTHSVLRGSIVLLRLSALQRSIRTRKTGCHVT